MKYKKILGVIISFPPYKFHFVDLAGSERQKAAAGEIQGSW